MRIRRAFGLLFVLVLLLFSGCVHKLRTDYPVAETVVWQENCAEIRLPLPEGWAWETIDDNGDNCFGFRFWPEESPKNRCELSFHPIPALYCPVGEHPEPFVLHNGLSGTRLPHEDYCYLIFKNTPGEYVARIKCYGTEPDSYAQWSPAFYSILNRAELGKGFRNEEDARAIACAAAGPDWTCGYGDYDWLDGSWTFYTSPDPGDQWRVNADGTAECLGPPET